MSVWCASRLVRVISSCDRIDGFGRAGLDAVGQGQRAAGGFEEMQRAKIFEQFGDARVGIEQFNAALIGRAGLVQLDPKSGQHAQKRAVHEHALRQINDETVIALLAELGEQRFKIGAEREIGAARDFQAGKILADQYR